MLSNDYERENLISFLRTTVVGIFGKALWNGTNGVLRQKQNGVNMKKTADKKNATKWLH
jgi:hypothetical protein